VTTRSNGASSAHDTHDRLLVARYATGDALAHDEAAAVRSLLAFCPGCNDLVAEMRVVVHATRQLPAPARTRDFRLTPDQAERLRPNRLQRLLGRLTGPSAGVLRPFAGATLAIGIVLVGASVALPGVQSSPTSAPRNPAATDLGLTSAAPELAQPSPAAADGVLFGSPGAEMYVTSGNPKATDPVLGRESLPTQQDVQGSDDPSVVARIANQGASPSPSARTALMPVPGPSAAPDPQDDRDQALATSRGIEWTGLSIALLALGLVLAAVGLLVLGLAWLARRNEDPLLR
jgi:hypothetical protein